MNESIEPLTELLRLLGTYDCRREMAKHQGHYYAEACDALREGDLPKSFQLAKLCINSDMPRITDIRWFEYRVSNIITGFNESPEGVKFRLEKEIKRLERVVSEYQNKLNLLKNTE
jgi:hypothetical protein